MKRRLINLRLTAILSVLVSVLTTTGQGQSTNDDKSWMVWKTGVGWRWLMYHLEKSEAEFLKAKWEAVGSQQNAGHKGDFIVPDHMSGYFLRWSEEQGYVFVRFFDVEHPCYFTYGDVKVTEATVRFIQKGSASRSVCPSSDDGAPSDEWVLAIDGRFLVPRSKLSDFAEYYGGFGKYNGNNRKFDDVVPYAVRVGSAPKWPPASVLPKEFSNFIKPPFVGQITFVGKTFRRKSKIFTFGTDYETVTPVRINVGQVHGLRRKQEFVLLTDDDDYSSETLIVESVGRSTSKAIVVRKIDENGKEGFSVWSEVAEKFETREFTKLRPGIRVTTSPVSKV